MRPFLIYTSAGTHNNVRRWVESEDRNYDLWVTNYSDRPGLLKDVADFYNERKGAKFPNFHHILNNHRDQLEGYQAIMVADDDIILSPKKLEGLFAQLVEQKLWIIVPAYSRFGKITHDTTERCLMSRYRYTNFAEVTCPVFNTKKLMEFMNVYDPVLPCYGVDWWYLNVMADTSNKKIVISDEFYCINPRDAHKSTEVREIDKFVSAEDRKSNWKEFKRNLGVTSFPKVVYSSVPESFPKIICRAPVFLAEVVLDKLLTVRFLEPLKRLLKRAMLAFSRRGKS